MKTKPFIFNFLMFFFIIVAISLPLQVMWLYEHQWGEMARVFAKLTPLNLIVIGLCLMASFYCYHGHRYLKTIIPITISLVALNNWVVSELGQDFNSTATLGASASFALFCSPLFFTKAYEILDNPNLRWWLTPKRVKKEIKIGILEAGGKALESFTFDISNTGAFLMGELAPEIMRLEKGQNIALEFYLKNGARLQLEAAVVRNTQGRGNYPSGLGVQFQNIGFRERWVLNSLTH